MIKMQFYTEGLTANDLMTECDPYHKALLEYIENDVTLTKELSKKFINERFGVPKNMDFMKTYIEKVIFNDPATIVIWADGTKTVVKAKNEVFDPEKGLAMAISKKFFGNRGNYFNVFKKWIPEPKIRELYDDIYLEDSYTTDENNLVLFFSAPRNLLFEKNEGAESIEIRLTVDDSNFNVKNASVMFFTKEDDSDDYWYPVNIPDDIIEYLIDLYKNSDQEWLE